MHADVRIVQYSYAQAFPYFYIPYDEDLPSAPNEGKCLGL